MENIRFISFDLDGTLTEENSWFLLNKAFGVTEEEDHELYMRYLKGEHDYHAWISALIALFHERGKGTKALAESVADNVSFREGAEETIRFLSQKYTLAIVSGAPDIIVKRVAKRLGIPFARGSTDMTFSEDGSFLDMKSLGEEGEGKIALFEEVLREANAAPSQSMHVGDSKNDRLIFEKVLTPVIFGDDDLTDREDVVRVHSFSELQSLFSL